MTVQAGIRKVVLIMENIKRVVIVKAGAGGARDNCGRNCEGHIDNGKCKEGCRDSIGRDKMNRTVSAEGSVKETTCPLFLTVLLVLLPLLPPWSLGNHDAAPPQPK